MSGNFSLQLLKLFRYSKRSFGFHLFLHPSNWHVRSISHIVTTSLFFYLSTITLFLLAWNVNTSNVWSFKVVKMWPVTQNVNCYSVKVDQLCSISRFMMPIRDLPPFLTRVSNITSILSCISGWVYCYKLQCSISLISSGQNSKTSYIYRLRY